MKAMILAAGLGTRLKPITDRIPKALVEVEGVPMLQRVILSLKSQGFDYIIVNAHHFASQIKEFLKTNDFGVKIQISDESDELLDTGGGLVKAMPLIFKYDKEPVLIHNVDILSNAEYTNLIQDLKNRPAAASLLVSERNSSRKLLFDRHMQLAGWHDLKNDSYRFSASQDIVANEFAFSGIYAMSIQGIEEMKKILGTGKYSVMDYFLSKDRTLGIHGRIQTGLKLLDIGKPATLLQAQSLLSSFNV